MMHLEILVEDASGALLIEKVLPRILGDAAGTTTYKVIKYKGIGKVPPGLKPRSDARARILLDQLPKLLGGYGKRFRDFEAAVVVVVDQDRRDCKALKAEMVAVLDACDPKPTALFRIAIEEMEAWLLGDRAALKAAYPRAKTRTLDGYVQDSVCDTWERLADAVYPGGAKALKEHGYPTIGRAKCEWAERVAPHIDVEGNASPSFQAFRDGIRRLVRPVG